VDYSKAIKMLSSTGQSHIFRFWDILAEKKKQHLLSQLADFDVKTFQIQQELVFSAKKSVADYSPLSTCDHSGNQRDKDLGKQMVASGSTGCLILAGGQGTRLSYPGPKGMFPVTAVKKKSLFQLFSEKTVAAGKQAGRLLPLAIMTSPQNHQRTTRFFEDHGAFGLEPEQLSFFSQGMLPMLDQKGCLFLEKPENIAESPDGNGAALHRFYQSGLWNDWHQRGIKFVNLILIDNPLADPFDAELFGYHQRNQNEITVKCALRQRPLENVGLIVESEGKIKVIEYSEVSESDRVALDTEGHLLFKCANLSLFCFSMEFIQRAATEPALSLPLHKALKSANCVDMEKEGVHYKRAMIWKFERFIFDLLPQAARIKALLYPRENCFAPLKNLTGENSMESVQKALQENDQRVFASATGITALAAPFEVAQDFYYPTPELLSGWQKKRLSACKGYIEAT
jgi:UDP-N-acetylglucosamine/UDP-N-acetylgalactosamine diphosphorylase